MSRTLTLKKEYYAPDGRKIKGFFTMNGKHVPIYAESQDDSKLEEHFKKENERVEKWQNSRQGSIEMDNGQILEHYSLDEMKKMILKDAKDAGEVYEDDAISIQYTDGTIESYVGDDDTSKMKLSNINGVIWNNANTTAFAGKGIKIENYKEKYPNDYPDSKGYEDDWRMVFETNDPRRKYK